MQLNKSRIAWVLYDFANSAFHLMIPTILFPLYFRKVIAPGASSPDFLWSLVVAVPVLITGVIAPVIGAIADSTQRRKNFLVTCLSVAIGFTCLLALVDQDSVLAGSFVFIVSMLAFHLSLFLYDAFLPLQTGGEKGTALLSSVGWGLGYLGGLLCLGMLYPILKGAELPAATRIFQLSFLGVAGFYFLFSIPTILYLEERRDPGKKEPADAWKAMRSGVTQVISTVQNWQKHKEVLKFLVGFYLVNDGLATLTYFTAIFASETVKMNLNEILFAFIIVQLIGIPATILFGLAAENFGYQRILLWTVALWVPIIIGFYFAQTKEHYYLLSVLVGMVIGSTPATARAVLAKMVKKEQTAEIYGFNALSARVSSILGPILFGVVSTVTGNQRLALLSLIIFFVSGFWVLRLVRVST